MPGKVHYPDAYVYRVACHQATDRLRGNRSWPCLREDDHLLADLTGPAPGPKLIAAVRSDAAAVDRTLQRLPHHHQRILLGLKLEERTRDNVATDDDMSLRTVDTLLWQARDYCAQQTGRAMQGGALPSRRPIPAARLSAR